MGEDHGELETELGRLRDCPLPERNDRIWRLTSRGPAIVADLQHIRRNGPGRLRAAALEILVNVVGEAGLHPADLAAAERLVRIKAPSEPFVNMMLCWDAWMCVRSGDQQAIIAALGLTPLRPATFDLAASVVSDSLDDPDGPVFVTPELNGWTVVAGRWCDPANEVRAEPVRRIVEQLSGVYGQVQACFLTEYSDCSAWLVAEHGRTIRRYSEDSPALAIGLPLPVERRYLDEQGITGSPEALYGDDDMADALSEFSGGCTARTVAAELGIDIVCGLWRSVADIRGIGVLARPPGATSSTIAPGAYRI